MINDGLNLHEGRLRQAIHDAAQRRNPFSTIDVIRLYSSHYHVNEATPVNASLNAEIGRFLSRNRETLGLTKEDSPAKQADDSGIETTTAMWLRG